MGDQLRRLLLRKLAAEKAPEANKFQHSCSRARKELGARFGGRFRHSLQRPGAYAVTDQ